MMAVHHFLVDVARRRADQMLRGEQLRGRNQFIILRG